MIAPTLLSSPSVNDRQPFIPFSVESEDTVNVVVRRSSPPGTKLEVKMHKMQQGKGLILALGATGLLASGGAWAKNWSGWSSPVSIEALPGSSSQLNTSVVDGCGSLSPDGLDYYFSSNRGTGSNIDLWVAHRNGEDEGFGPPESISAINSTALEICPTMTPGGRLYFTSMRDDPAGDIYVAKLGNGGWSAPERLGSAINNPGSIEESPSFYEDEDGLVMYFSSNRGGQQRVYYSVNFGPAQLASGGVNSSAADSRPGVSKDGLEIFWNSTRYGSLGQADIWSARRSSTSQSWGTAQHEATLSSPADDRRPSLSRDGGTLLIARVPGPEGSIDEVIAMRNKITGK